MTHSPACAKCELFFMKILQPTPQLLKYFRSRPDMLIFEGYCRLSDNVTICNDGDDWALVTDVGNVHKCCISATNMNFVQRVIEGLHGNVELCGVDAQLTEFLKSRYHYQYETHCMLCVWNGQPLPHKNVLKTHPMLPKYAQLISDGTHYHAATDEIIRCLELHPSAAIYIDDKPVCWCLCHLEKSLGMLFTLPEHRHKGYALEVMTALCNEVIARGDVPFAYIVTDNVASLNLVQKYNLTQVKRADYFSFFRP